MQQLDEDRYLTYADVALRLGNTIVRYDGEFVYVQALTEPSLHVQITFLNKTDTLSGDLLQKQVHANDLKFDLESPLLGWAQYDASVPMFFSRAPYRRQKQGLHKDNISYRTLDDPKTAKLINTNWITSKFLTKMLLGEYREFPKVYQRFKEGKTTAEAISRLYCLRMDPNTDVIKMYRKMYPVGTLDSDGVLVLDKFYDNSLVRMTMANLNVPVKVS